jgi:hypothetical protein
VRGGRPQTGSARENTACVSAQACSHTALGLTGETKQVFAEDRNAVVVESRIGVYSNISNNL